VIYAAYCDNDIAIVVDEAKQVFMVDLQKQMLVKKQHLKQRTFTNNANLITFAKEF